MLFTGDRHFQTNNGYGPFAGGGNTLYLASDGAVGELRAGYRFRDFRVAVGYLHAVPESVPGY